MRVRLRHVSRTRAGKRAVRDEVLDTDVVTIGRGTDNRIQLSGLTIPLRHSQVRGGEAGLRIERVEPDTLQVNGRLVTGHVLRVGDVMNVGQFDVRSLPLEGSEALALEVEQVRRTGSEAQAFRDRSRMGIERGLLSRRFLSWAALVAVAVGGYLLPARALRLAEGPAAPAPPRWAAEAWSTGPVTRAHAGVSTRCAACHTTPFAAVDNTACLACHASTARHAAPAVAEVAAAPCTSCHREHRGESLLTNTEPAVCTSCHAEPARFQPTARLEPVHAFAAGGAHPELSVFAPDGPGASSCSRLSADPQAPPKSLAPEPLIVRAGLRFNHAQHLAPGLRDRWAQSRATRAVALRCADCHQLDATGRFMQPVTFADHCQTCHDLAFSERDPSRQAPHPAPPAAVRTQVLEFFARAALGDAAPDAPASRRRPGRELTATAQRAALARADQDAERALADLLGTNGIDPTHGARGTCAVCHQFLASGAVVPTSMSGTAARCAAMRVPVDPTTAYAAPSLGRWMPRALFSHGAHRTEPCERCHNPATALGTTGLLPGKAACLACHGADTATFSTGSLAACGVCHRYHQPDRGPLAAADR